MQANLPREGGNPCVIRGRLPGSHITDLQQKPWRRIRARRAVGTCEFTTCATLVRRIYLTHRIYWHYRAYPVSADTHYMWMLPLTIHSGDDLSLAGVCDKRVGTGITSPIQDP